MHVGLGKHIILSKDPVAYAKVCIHVRFMQVSSSHTYNNLQLQDAIAAQVISATGVVPMKLSLIFLYRRIFPNRWLNWFHITLWVIGGVVVSMAIAADCLAILKCLPLKSIEDHTIKSRCIDFGTWIAIHGLHNIITDFMLLFLPMPLVWRLNMTRMRKIQVSGIFALGALYAKQSAIAFIGEPCWHPSSSASIASIIRIYFLLKASPSSHALDPTCTSINFDSHVSPKCPYINLPT